MIKEISKINAGALLDAYLSLEEGINWTDFGHKGKQAGIQSRSSENLWDDAVGRSKGEELSYGYFNPYFKNSIFEILVNTYNMKRSRLMWVNPFACYSMHKDEAPRIHIPIVTNAECYFLFRDEPPAHLKEGSIYWVDTRRKHTFINCSDLPRLHLVGIVEK